MAGKDERDPGINPTAKGGPASPIIPDSGGAQAGGGPHVGAAEGNVKGVLGMGSSAVGHPTGGMGDRSENSELPLSDEDRAQGIVSERNVSVLGGGPAVAREAGALDQGAGPPRDSTPVERSSVRGAGARDEAGNRNDRRDG